MFRPLPQDDPLQRCPGISRACEHLNGWEPKFDLDAGLERPISYFAKRIGHPFTVERSELAIAG